jgi:2,3-bisphosphoglycerate-dependent phosphoglycerate mutase
VPAVVLLLRHAQSTWNLEGRWQGQADPPLSAFGEGQALEAAGRLETGDSFGLFVSSDLARARQTAELMADALGAERPPAVEVGLREYDLGEWSGLTREEILTRWPAELQQFDRGELDAPPGGESRQAFDLRVAAAGNRVAELTGATKAERVLVVTHAGVVRSFARSAGLPERHMGHLSGYWATVGRTGGLRPRDPVELLAPVSREDEEGDEIAQLSL